MPLRSASTGDRPLYGVLGLSGATATAADIARSYRRLALTYHPDRNPDGAEKFKELSNAYAVLSDPEKKGMYDLTGIVPGSAEDPLASGGAGAEADLHARSAEIKRELLLFFSAYAGSEEERADVVKSFAKTGGDFRAMIRECLLFDNGKKDEVQRLHAVACALLKQGRLTPTAAWEKTASPQGIRRAERDMRREREEAEEMARSMGLDGSESGTDAAGDMGALQALIQQRQQSSWESMMQGLEARYVNKEGREPSTRRHAAAKKKKNARKESTRQGSASTVLASKDTRKEKPKAQKTRHA